MELKKNYKFWFATGSQDLYGDECLSHVAKHAQIIVQNFNERRHSMPPEIFHMKLYGNRH